MASGQVTTNRKRDGMTYVLLIILPLSALRSPTLPRNPTEYDLGELSKEVIYLNISSGIDIGKGMLKSEPSVITVELIKRNMEECVDVT